MMKTLVATGFIATVLATAPVAAADINVSGVNVPVGNGTADATFGNVAVALRGGTAQAQGGIGNIAIATGEAEASKIHGGSFNAVVAHGDGAQAVLETGVGFNVVAAIGSGSEARLDATPLPPKPPFIPGGPGYGGSANIVLAGRDSTAHARDTQLSLTAALCGGSTLNAQSVRIKVSASCLGGERRSTARERR